MCGTEKAHDEPQGVPEVADPGCPCIGTGSVSFLNSLTSSDVLLVKPVC